MKIAIISDTHVCSDMHRLQKFIELNLINMDMVIHTGDITSMLALTFLQSLKNFVGVYGNCDEEEVKSTLKEKLLLTIEGYRLGIFHGHGKNKAIQNALEAFGTDEVDIIIFGHSHQPVIKTHNKLLLLNPGSIFYKRKEPWFSYIILDLTKDKLCARIIFTDNHSS